VPELGKQSETRDNYHQNQDNPPASYADIPERDFFCAIELIHDLSIVWVIELLPQLDHARMVVAYLGLAEIASGSNTKSSDICSVISPLITRPCRFGHFGRMGLRGLGRQGDLGACGWEVHEGISEPFRLNVSFESSVISADVPS
jgi:hypothetical protein